ncbi:MAG: hypothetical protein V1738_07080 [Patescibacteria group bacterium]
MTFFQWRQTVSERRIIKYMILASSFEDFDAPCCGATKDVCQLVHRESGGIVYQCYACGDYFAVASNVIKGIVMKPGFKISFEETTDLAGQRLTLVVQKHPFDFSG